MERRGFDGSAAAAWSLVMDRYASTQSAYRAAAEYVRTLRASHRAFLKQIQVLWPEEPWVAPPIGDALSLKECLDFSPVLFFTGRGTAKAYQIEVSRGMSASFARLRDDVTLQVAAVVRNVLPVVGDNLPLDKEGRLTLLGSADPTMKKIVRAVSLRLYGEEHRLIGAVEIGEHSIPIDLL